MHNKHVMRKILITIFLFGYVYLSGQTIDFDTIKVQLMAGKEPLPGATFIIKGCIPPAGSISDINGLAILSMPVDKDTVEISILGPYIALEILRPVDSIYFDINSKYATYYYKNKKIKRKKQVVDNY